MYEAVPDLANVGYCYPSVVLQGEEVAVGETCDLAVADVFQLAARVVHNIGTAVYS